MATNTAATPNQETRTQYGEVLGNTLLTPPRVNAIHASSLWSASSYATVGSNAALMFVEICNTFAALGQWA